MVILFGGLTISLRARINIGANGLTYLTKGRMITNMTFFTHVNAPAPIINTKAAATKKSSQSPRIFSSLVGVLLLPVSAGRSPPPPPPPSSSFCHFFFCPPGLPPPPPAEGGAGWGSPLAGWNTLEAAIRFSMYCPSTCNHVI